MYSCSPATVNCSPAALLCRSEIDIKKQVSLSGQNEQFRNPGNLSSRPHDLLPAQMRPNALLSMGSSCSKSPGSNSDPNRPQTHWNIFRKSSPADQPESQSHPRRAKLNFPSLLKELARSQGCYNVRLITVAF